MRVRLTETAQAEAGGPEVGNPHVGPKKSLLAATGFTRQGVGIRLSCGSSTAAIEVTGGS